MMGVPINAATQKANKLQLSIRFLRRNVSDLDAFAVIVPINDVPLKRETDALHCRASYSKFLLKFVQR